MQPGAGHRGPGWGGRRHTRGGMRSQGAGGGAVPAPGRARCRRGGGERGGAAPGPGWRRLAAGGGAGARSGPGPAGPEQVRGCGAPGWRGRGRVAGPARRLRGQRGRPGAGRPGAERRRHRAPPGHCPGTAPPRPRVSLALHQVTPCTSPAFALAFPLRASSCIIPPTPRPALLLLPLPCPLCPPPHPPLKTGHNAPLPSYPCGSRCPLMSECVLQGPGGSGGGGQCSVTPPPPPRAPVQGIARAHEWILVWCSRPSPCKAGPTCVQGCVCAACSVSRVSVSSSACPVPMCAPLCLAVPSRRGSLFAAVPNSPS